jgi:type II secretory pathway component PulJ
MRLLALCASIPCLLAAQSAPDAREIVRRSVELDRKNEAIARNYTFLERDETRMLDRSGKPKKAPESRTFDVTLLEGSPYRRLVKRNDRPLPPEEERKEQEKLRKSIDERSKETPAERQNRIAEWDRKQQRQRAPFQEIPDAFDLRLAGEETLDGRGVYVIAATPKPGYKPKLASAAYFPKIKGKLWIDKRDNQWVRGEIETLDTISIGGILVRLAKGSRATFEATRVNDEVWLPKQITLDGSARLLLVVGARAQIDIAFSNYRKFQADSRLVPQAQ